MLQQKKSEIYTLFLNFPYPSFAFLMCAFIHFERSKIWECPDQML